MIVNLRESLNTRDRKSVNGNSKYYDLVNLYESCNLSTDNKKTLAKMINNNASDKAIYSFLYECYEGKEDIKEDTVKKDGKWVNKGKEGTHGEFKTKKAADAQRKAMFANGYKGESLKESTSIYRDYNGIMGNPGATWTIKELKAYWETNHNSDPVLNEYKSMQSWLNDTIAMLHPVTNDEYDESLKESVNSDIVSMIKKQFPKATVKTSVRKHSDVHKSNPDTPVGKTKYVDIRITPDSASSVNSILQYCNHNIKKVLDSDERFDYYGDVPARNPRGSKEVVLSYQDYSGLSDDEYKSLLGESVNPADLTDCPACGDVSFDSKRGRCTKCNYREESLAEDKGQPRSNRYTTYFNRIKRAIEKGDEETLKRTKEAIMYAPAKELKNSEARELMNMIKNRKITESVSGKYGEVKYEPRRDGMSGESAVYANYHLFSNDGKYTPYWAGERPMGSSYNSVEDAVKGIDTFIDRQRKDGKMLYMKPVKESLESEDGWSEEILDIVDPFFVEVETVAYELRNTVRGAYRFGTTVEDLVQVFRGFSETADDIANELDDNQEHLEEDWCSIKEEPHEECVGNNCTDEHDLFPEEKYFTIVVTRSDDGEDEIIDDVTKEIADKYIDDLKRDNDEFFSHAKVLDHNGKVVNSWEYLEEAAKSKKSSSIKDRLKELIPDLNI